VTEHSRGQQIDLLPDLETWRRQWQAQGAGLPPADLRARVAIGTRRETQRMKLTMIGPVLVTILAGGGSLYAALTFHRPADVALAVGVWSFLLVVWVGATWIARGTWRPLTETTDEFLRVSIQRCRSALYGIRFGLVLYVLGFAAALLWQHFQLSATRRALLTAWPVILLGPVVTPILLLVSFKVDQKRRAELEWLLGLRRQLQSPGANATLELGPGER